MSKSVTISIMLGVVVIIGLIFLAGSNIRNSKVEGETVDNTEIRDGIQYITISAKGGYSPKMSVAQAGIPTKLIIKTNGTYDCSAALVIRSVGFQQILPQTGETEIDLGIPKAGAPVQGICGMGMYNFQIEFADV